MTSNFDNKIGGFLKNIENDGDTMKIDSKHKCAINLMENLKKMLDQRVFCDTVLVAGNDNTTVPSHRNVLMTSSKYFYAMFTSGITENDRYEIILKNVNGRALQDIIHYYYTGELKISSKNVEMLLSTASQLEFVEIKKECSTYLKKCLQKNPLNCLSFYAMAYLYNLIELKMLAQQLMCKHFMKIKDSEEFLSLDINVLQQLVQNNDLVTKQEEDVFTTVLNWINHNMDNRQQHLIDLLKIIRYTKMELTFLTENVSEILISNGLKDLFADSINIKCIPNCMPQCTPQWLLNPRNVLKSERNINAFILLRESTFFTTFTLHREIYDGLTWKYLDSDTEPIDPQSILQLENKWLFITTSGHVIILDDSFLNKSLIPRRTGEMGRVYYTAVCWDNQIYVLETREYYVTPSDDSPAIINILTFNKLDPSTKNWITIATFTDHKSSTGATAGNNKIYYGQVQKSIQFFDLTTNTSGTLEGRNSAKEIKNMVFCDGYLYVAGENYMEKYDFSTETWTLMHEGKSNIIPGRQTNQIMRMDEKEIQIFCPKENEWLSCGKLSNEYAVDSKYFFICNNE